jgi:hypothetical protein
MAFAEHPRREAERKTACVENLTGWTLFYLSIESRGRYTTDTP